MKKLMTFITLSAIAISNYAQANEQPHQAHMNMQMSTGSAMQQELMQATVFFTPSGKNTVATQSMKHAYSAILAYLRHIYPKGRQ